MKLLGGLVLLAGLVCVGVLIYGSITDLSFVEVFQSIFGTTPAIEPPVE